MSTATHPHEILHATGFTFCSGCRGVLSGKCGCVMWQDGIDTSNCIAHRGVGHVGRCTCAPRPPVVLRYEIRCEFATSSTTRHDGADLEYGPDDGGVRALAVANCMSKCRCGGALIVWTISRQRLA